MVVVHVVGGYGCERDIAPRNLEGVFFNKRVGQKFVFSLRREERDQHINPRHGKKHWSHEQQSNIPFLVPPITNDTGEKYSADDVPDDHH